MPRFKVAVTVENRQGLSDPEGETILRDLVLKSGRGEGGGGRVSEIRTAKMLRMVIDAADAESAVRDVRGICDGLRLYNPLVSTVDVTVVGGIDDGITSGG